MTTKLKKIQFANRGPFERLQSQPVKYMKRKWGEDRSRDPRKMKLKKLKEIFSDLDSMVNLKNF